MRLYNAAHIAFDILMLLGLVGLIFSCQKIPQRSKYRNHKVGGVLK